MLSKIDEYIEAMHFYALEDWNKARRKFLFILECPKYDDFLLDPDKAYLYKVIGDTFILESKLSDALIYYERSVLQDQKSPLMPYLIAKFLLEINTELSHAESMCLKAKKILEKKEESDFGESEYLSKKEYEDDLNSLLKQVRAQK